MFMHGRMRLSNAVWTSQCRKNPSRDNICPLSYQLMSLSLDIFSAFLTAFSAFSMVFFRGSAPVPPAAYAAWVFLKAGEAPMSQAECEKALSTLNAAPSFRSALQLPPRRRNAVPDANHAPSGT